MELGWIGLGRMGINMARRQMRSGHHCVVYDLHPDAVQALVHEGATSTISLDDFADKLLSSLRFQFGGHQEKTAAGNEGA